MSDSQNCQSSERIQLLDVSQSEIGWAGLPCCEPRRNFGCFEFDNEKSGRPALPLAAVDVSAKIIDRIASVTVVQKFINQLSEPIEAVYIFPLAGSSSVSKFQMQVGERTIDGIVKERAEARQEYQAAIEEGKRAAILEQERDDVFTAQVGNIMPGEEITVTIVYSERLTYFASGHTEIRLPLVVAPRYVAGAALDRENVGDGVELDTDMVSDASRISPPRLAPGFDPKVALSLIVEIELGDDAQLEDLLCSQHATKQSFAKSVGSGKSKSGGKSASSGGHVIKVALAKEDEHLDRDFVLSWKLAGSELSSVGLVSKPVFVKDREFQYGMVSINPPAIERASSKLVARDVVFLLDRSGSMSGLKMTSATRSLVVLLNTLRPDDRFAICAFDDITEWLMDSADLGKFADVPFDTRRFLPASPRSIERGIAYLRSIDPRGGTEMRMALDDCFDVVAKAPVPLDSSASRSKVKGKRQAVVVLITDGEVADESHILKTIQSKVGTTRVFTVGVDTAVNDGFLNRLASLGGGTCTLVTPGDALENALINVAREIGVPLVTDLHIVNNKDLTCAPHKKIDLFEGRPVSIYFQFASEKLPASVEVIGRLSSGGKYKETISLVPTDNAALPQLFAKARISELEDLMRDAGPIHGSVHEPEIIELSIAHSLLTRFTAFLAVDHSEIVNASGGPRKLVQPAETPAHWQTFGAGGWGSALPSPQQMPACPAPGSPPPSAMRARSASADASISYGGIPAPSGGLGGGAKFGGGAWGGSYGSASAFNSSDNYGLGGGYGSNEGSGELTPPEPLNYEMSLQEQHPADLLQIKADWTSVRLLLERLITVVAALAEMAEGGGDDWQNELTNLREIEDELIQLASINHVLFSHPDVAPVFEGKIMPALRSLIDGCASNFVTADVIDGVHQITLYCEQIRLYEPDLSADDESQSKPPKQDSTKKKGILGDIASFWKNNI